jgi:hypothetical protein
MSSLISADEIRHETEIVWLEDIDDLDYVRQSLDRLPNRKSKPAYHRDGRMVGYAFLGDIAKASRASGTFAAVSHHRHQPPYADQGDLMSVGELADRVGITPANLARLHHLVGHPAE